MFDNVDDDYIIHDDTKLLAARTFARLLPAPFLLSYSVFDFIISLFFLFLGRALD